MKKLLTIALSLVVVTAGGLYFWAQAIFSSETVRTSVESQLSASLGQPVRIGRIGATVIPRVTMTLNDVRIGDPVRITAASLHVGTDFRALLTRRIEHGQVKLSGSRIDLPLPAFTLGASTASTQDASSTPAIEIVSIDEVTLSDITVTSGRRTVHADVDLVPSGQGVDIRRIAITADGATVTVTGRIDDLAGPTGELSIEGGALNIDALATFFGDFAMGAGFSAAPARTAAARPGPAPRMRMGLTIDVARGQVGTLALSELRGKAVVTPGVITIDPVSFGVFGGVYTGAFVLTLGEAPTGFRLRANVARVDVGALMGFVGSPGAMTGTLGGRLDVSGQGLTTDDVARTLRGTSAIDVTNGHVKGLGLVRALVLAGSMRKDSQVNALGSRSDEPFSRLGATFTMANGSASTGDLRFESPDVLLSGTGALRLDGTDLRIAARVQLSDALSAQAGQDLVRYTQDNGRVTLPAIVTGGVDSLHVGVDVTGVAKRAIGNRAKEEISKGLGGLLRR